MPEKYCKRGGFVKVAYGQATLREKQPAPISRRSSKIDDN